MTQILVTTFSKTGHTEALAEAVIEGVRGVEGVTCVVKSVPETTMRQEEETTLPR